MINFMGSEWLSVYSRMKDENHPAWQRLIWVADQTNTKSQQSGDGGKAPAIAYKITGNVAYANAWYDFTNNSDFSSSLSDNSIRREFLFNVVEANLVWDGLSKDKQDVIQKRLLDTVKHVLGDSTDPKNQFEFRKGDSDQTIGAYFGILAYDAMFGTNYLDSTVASGSQPGGLFTNQSDLSLDTARNNIYNYCTRQDGFWIESSEYNLTTYLLLAMGYQVALSFFNGVDNFPEIKNALCRGAEQMAATTFNKLDGWLQWGNEDFPRMYDGRIFQYLQTVLSLGGITKNNKLIKIGQDFIAKYNVWFTPKYCPWSATFLFYNPYLYSAISYPEISFVDSKRGMIVNKTNSKFVSLSMLNPTYVDHYPYRYSTVEIKDDNEWIIPSVLGYNTRLNEAENSYANTLYGFTALTNTRNTKTVNNDRFSLLCGETLGLPYNFTKLATTVPVEFGSCSKYLLWLKDGILVIRDNVKITNPRKLSRFNKYKQYDLDRMDKYNHYNHFFPIRYDNNPVVSARQVSYNTESHFVNIQTLQDMQIFVEDYSDYGSLIWSKTSGPKDKVTKKIRMYCGDEFLLEAGSFFYYVISIDKNVVSTKLENGTLSLVVDKLYEHTIDFSTDNVVNTHTPNNK